MTDEHKLIAERERAHLARQILDNPLWREIVEVMRQDIDRRWLDSPARDVEGREELFKLRHTVDKFELCVHTIIDTGKMADIEIHRLKRREEKRQHG